MLLFVVGFFAGSSFTKSEDEDLADSAQKSISSDTPERPDNREVTNTQEPVERLKSLAPYVLRLETIPPKDPFELIGETHNLKQLDFDWSQPSNPRSRKYDVGGVGQWIALEEGDVRIVERVNSDETLDSRWQEQLDPYSKKWVSHGPSIVINDSGVEVCFYYEGKLSGRRLHYTPEGRLKLANYYVDHLVIRTREWNEDGSFRKQYRIEWELPDLEKVIEFPIP